MVEHVLMTYILVAFVIGFGYLNYFLALGITRLLFPRRYKEDARVRSKYAVILTAMLSLLMLVVLFTSELLFF